MNNQWKMVPVEPTPEMLKVEVSPALCLGLPSNPRVGQWRLGVYRAMLAAAPVPPAGDVEVLAWKRTWTSHHDSDGSLFEATDFHENHAFGEKNGDTPLVDRAHVTRLQAEVSALQQRLNIADQRVCDLQTDLTKAQFLVDQALHLQGEHYGDGMGLHLAMIKWARAAGQSAPAAKMCDCNQGRLPCACNVDESCGQDAEAAKGGSDE